MPDFAVASSKRIGPGAAAGGVCASIEEDSRRNPRSRFVTLVSSCSVLRACASHVGWSGRLQQDHRDRILRRGLRSGVAADAGTLFPAAHPEKSRLVLQSLARLVQQFDLQRLLGGDLDEEGSVAFDWGGTEQSRIARVISRIQPHRMNR